MMFQLDSAFILYKEKTMKVKDLIRKLQNFNQEAELAFVISETTPNLVARAVQALAVAS